MIPVVTLTATDGVILPLKCEWDGLNDLQHLLHLIHMVRGHLNNKVMLFGVVLTMYDPRTSMAKEVVDEIGQHFPKEIFDTIIFRNIRLSEALILPPHHPGARFSLARRAGL